MSAFFIIFIQTLLLHKLMEMEMENFVDEEEGLLVVVLEFHEAQDEFLGCGPGELLFGSPDEPTLRPVVTEDFELVMVLILGILFLI
jgi:hypothetical protein